MSAQTGVPYFLSRAWAAPRPAWVGRDVALDQGPLLALPPLLLLRPLVCDGHRSGLPLPLTT